MKRFLILVLTLLFIAGCESGNQGYGYSVKPENTVSQQSPSEKKQSTYRSRWEAHTMKIHGLDGTPQGDIQAYKGEFDGKTWYVFIAGDGRMAVVEDTSEKTYKVKSDGKAYAVEEEKEEDSLW